MITFFSGGIIHFLGLLAFLISFSFPFGYTHWCSGLNSGSILKGPHIGPGIESGSGTCRAASYPLCYFSGFSIISVYYYCTLCAHYQPFQIDKWVYNQNEELNLWFVYKLVYKWSCSGGPRLSLAPLSSLSLTEKSKFTTCCVERHLEVLLLSDIFMCWIPSQDSGTILLAVK